MQIFNGNGLSRARQEIASARAMIEDLTRSQQRLTAQSANMRLISPSALNDINRLNSRIGNIRTTITNLEREKRRLSRWDTAGINQYNSRIESIRSQLSRILEVQRQWNSALRANNVQQVNASYLQLRGIIDGIDVSIRNNTNAQRQFNNSLSQGQGKANGLKRILGSFTGMAGIYAGIRALQSAVKITDNYTNINSRLSLLTENAAELRDLQNQIYRSAMNSRSAYNDTASSMAKLGLLAKESFGNNDEIVLFSELMNKSFKISGASTQEQQAGMYQLTQAMAAGKLQGDEFRSIMENAPMLAQAIADYTGKTKGDLKDMSRDGVITADVVKNSLFSAADDINSKFAQMPITFGDALSQIRNTATMIFAPVMQQANGFLTQDRMSGILNSVVPIFEFFSLKLSQFGSYFSELAERASPAISAIGGAFANVGRYILSANGLFGTLMRTMNKLAVNKGVKQMGLVIASGFMVASQAIGFVVESIGWLAEHFEGLLPAVGGAVTAIATFNALNSISSRILNGVGDVIRTVSNVTNGMRVATDLAANAQRGLNMALNANPYMMVASAIMTVVSALGALVSGIAAVNKAAGLASNGINSGIGGYSDEAWKIQETTGYSIQIAQEIADENENYKKSKKDFEDRLAKEKQELYKNKAWYERPTTGYHYQGAEINLTKTPKELQDAKAMGEATVRMLETEGEFNLRKLHANRLTDIVNRGKAENNLQSMLDGLSEQVKGSSIDVPPIGDIDNVGKVGSVDKVNEPVDITSEDLRYLRELASMESINLFTQQTLAPQVNVSFGDVHETADVSKIVDEIERGIFESLAMSSDGVPAT